MHSIIVSCLGNIMVELEYCLDIICIEKDLDNFLLLASRSKMLCEDSETYKQLIAV